jgi:hypothetical protein
MSVLVTADLSTFRRQIAALGDKAPLAVARALNRSIASVQTAAVRDMAKDLNLAQKDVRKGLEITKATRQSLLATLRVTSKRLLLMAFGARQTAKGVTYNLGRGRTLAEGAFIAAMKSGHVGVFRRVGRARLPLTRELRGPSLPHVFTAERIRAAREALAQDLLRKNLTHEVEFLVSGVRKAS